MLPMVPLLRLLRPANIITAVSDILAGIAIAVFASQTGWAEWQISSTVLLVFSTIGLYGGGVVLNDVFDAELDKLERPERPIPAGLISKKTAGIAGILLLTGGVLMAGFVHETLFFSSTLYIALAIALAAIFYDKWGKHLTLFGP
ncbi:MAG: UbiA family prenyltransferase, partial [Chitinophagaceae bacterium]